MYNTLLKITELEMNYPNLKTVHRLDRQTSGIIFFAKKVTSSNDFREAMIADKVSKVYYARVLGDFRKACVQSTGESAAVDDVAVPEEEKKEEHLASGEEGEKQTNGTVVEEEKNKKEGEAKLSVTCSMSVYCVSNVEALWACSKTDEVPFEYRPKAKTA